MSSQSAGCKAQSTAVEFAQRESEDPKNVSTEDAEASSGRSVCLNSGAVREEQVQNAMKFLSHPRVRSSPVVHQRTFLEKKGLTKEEIDVALQREKAARIGREPLLKSSTDDRPQVSLQVLQPSGAIASLRPLHWYHFHWSHSILAIGLLAASGAATAIFLKNSFIPRLKSWIYKVIPGSSPTLVEGRGSCRCGKSAAEDVKLDYTRNVSESDVSDLNYQPPPEKIAEAHRVAKFAVGALAFDDVSGALDYLRKSVELLTNPSAVP
ncbi:peroxisomal membrane protein PEX14-like isoform X2 [Punica granatum]|uniref:Peroxisomal membrane protein PEX14 n=1 Tax=Punica granatum TaxID=22663 RepID=A0A6P8BZS5_PUNGR|nr:peroxisomal membrane protein PEX14-like isoform X2 [Punica granatum]